jgi:DNA-binding transcriptional LysR family regulator
MDNVAMDVDTRSLRYFVAVAEELHFTRAAERLFISQPALSKAVRQLETELRAALFVRTRREVSLTPAGQALLPIARGLIDDWQTGLRVTRAAADAAHRVVRVGFAATGAGPLSTRIRAEFVRRHPEVTVEPKRFDWGAEADAVRDGLVDVAFVWLPNDLTGLDVEPIVTETRLAGFAVGHPLAEKNELSIMDVAAEPMMWTRQAPKAWVDWWAVNPRPDGSEPTWGPENDNVEEMLEGVATGEAICFVPTSMAAYYARPDLVWRPLVDVEPLQVVLAWPAEVHNPMIAAFVAVARSVVTG